MLFVTVSYTANTLARTRKLEKFLETSNSQCEICIWPSAVGEGRSGAIGCD
jgi:hypothetical protein